MKHETHAHILARVQTAADDKYHRQLAKLVTTCLWNRFTIHDGNYLCGIIGDSDARDNREAIETWVSGHIPPGNQEGVHAWTARLGLELKYLIDSLACE